MGCLGVGDLLALVVQALDEFSHGHSLSVGKDDAGLGGLDRVLGGSHGLRHPAEEDRGGHAHEGGEQAEGDDEGDEADEGNGVAAGGAQGLQRGPHAVPQVQAQGGERDEVDEVDPPQLEIIVKIHIGSPMLRMSTRSNSQRCKLQNVPHNEKQQKNTTPPHSAHGITGGKVLRTRFFDCVLIRATRLLVAGPQVESAAGVGQEAGHESRTQHPQDTGRGQDRHEQLAQEVGVVVVGDLALEVVGVAVGVEEDEHEEEQARPGHQALHEDRRHVGGSLLGRSRHFDHPTILRPPPPPRLGTLGPQSTEAPHNPVIAGKTPPTAPSRHARQTN